MLIRSEEAMGSDFDKFADSLQKSILQKMAETYSKKVMEIFLNPKNIGRMDNPDGYGRVTGPCGDTMEMYLRIKDGIIAEAKFFTDGCGTTIVCGSMITELVKGKRVEDALDITNQTVLENLGGLPEPDQHCALLAADTLREATADFLKGGSAAKEGFVKKDINGIISKPDSRG